MLIKFSEQETVVPNTFTGMLRETLFVFAAFIVLAGATIVNDCDNGIQLEDSIQVTVSGCRKPICILKQNTTVTIQIKFKPKKQIQRMDNAVSAFIFNVPLSFVGVDGTNACDNIYNADGSKAGCPLQEGVEYTYKNSFDVLAFYPKVSLTVLYALKEGNDQVLCFEIPLKITK
ncbi:NPC intracellular cholesterol transporter 2 homolog a [Harpegnathos saltator]|uniref:Protein NPC2-like protein n=1 Tax=Harpegnathos saltator TaxID=610380 RepID=E2BSK8_HARSA|nr:NPC intracellular cholesterol transporter 2 homolog a [Harpegnathos saltator]EFN81341.1 Protein NPC2-like protein [Harpegnathos saltator]